MDSLREWLNGKRDYASGVKLYQELGTDPAMKRMFSEPESEFKKKKLVKALEDIYEGEKRGIQSVSSPPPALISTQPVAPHIEELKEIKQELDHVAKELQETRDQLEDLEWEKSDLEDENFELQEKLRSIKQRNGWPVEMDDIIAALHAQWKQKFLTMVDLQSRLYEVARVGKTDKAKEREAGEMALKILDLRDEVIATYAKRDHYLVNGNLPEEPTKEEECLDPMLWPVKLANAQRYARDYRSKLNKLGETNEKYLPTLQQLQKWEKEIDKYKKLLKKD
jgi:chromosome segregation ATPase